MHKVDVLIWLELVYKLPDAHALDVVLFGRYERFGFCKRHPNCRFSRFLSLVHVADLRCDKLGRRRLSH